MAFPSEFQLFYLDFLLIICQVILVQHKEYQAHHHAHHAGQHHAGQLMLPIFKAIPDRPATKITLVNAWLRFLL